jgi:hypothetical protein
MRTVTNTKLIRRNAKIGQYTNIGALVILGGGLYLSVKMPDKFFYSMVCLLVGFVLSQFGIYYGNRWTRSPRPDEVVDRSLKGMGREYIMYHYVTPTSHLLVSPAGIWVILPRLQAAKITYEKNRWRAKGGGFVQSYLRAFGQESIGRPDLEAEAEIESVKRFLKRKLPEGTELPQIRALMLFANPKVDLQANDAPLPALTPDRIKEFLKDAAKAKPFPPLMLAAIHDVLPQAEKDE